MTRCGKSTAPPPSHAKTRGNHALVHTRHTTYTTRTTHRLVSVSSRLFSLLFLFSISSAIMLKLTFANMSVGLARPCEQETRMPTNITAQKNFITLLLVCFLLADVVACSLLVGCWLYVRCMFAVSLDWLVGWLSQPNTDANCQLCLHIQQTPRWTTHKKDDINGRVV